ncbi:hypothetical protein Hanom_Chr01g00065421 [Helianthus anomalus]
MLLDPFRFVTRSAGNVLMQVCGGGLMLEHLVMSVDDVSVTACGGFS